MRLAGNRERIEREIGNITDSSVRGAIALISAPKRLEAGKYARAVADAVTDWLDLDAFQQARTQHKIRREAYDAIDSILTKIAELARGVTSESSVATHAATLA